MPGGVDGFPESGLALRYPAQPDDDHSFVTIYEVFKSTEALDAHRKTEHYQECVRRIDPILAGPRTKTFYNVELADFLGAGQP